MSVSELRPLGCLVYRADRIDLELEGHDGPRYWRLYVLAGGGLKLDELDEAPPNWSATRGTEAS